MAVDTGAEESPLQRLRAELERPPYNRWIAAEAVNADEAKREIVIVLGYREELSHDPSARIFHGGVLAALIDVAGYAAVAVWHRKPTPTIALQVDYLAPAISERIYARGILRRLGRSVSRADVEITASGKLVAIGRGTFDSRG